MASNSSFDPKVVMSKGKRTTASYVHADCSNSPCPQHLNAVLDVLLNPFKSIDEWETIEWCKWLMAGGRTPDDFAQIVLGYDNAETCGLVWTPNFVAYRCRTCGISPCMSLCTDCFKKGNHNRHDFNMFLSQAGGACDCGDTSVMREQGFCDRHGPGKRDIPRPPNELMCVAEAMMPRIIFRLILHLRENWLSFKDSNRRSSPMAKAPLQDADAFIRMLLEINEMGSVMRRTMTNAMTNPQKYRLLNEVPLNADAELAAYYKDSQSIYEKAVQHLRNPDPPEEYKSCPSLVEVLTHRTFLEELVFWSVCFEFPQKLVCFLLNMLPDPVYKDALTRAFILHYSRIAMMLEKSKDPDTLSNRVVHVSVQLFSNESLALRMANELQLLHVMVISLRYMMAKIIIPSTLHDPDYNFHYVVDCEKQVMKEHCYWPLVSDLNNVLSHRPVALKFLADDCLTEMWFNFLAMYQGMNVNQMQMDKHVEREPNTYYAAFSAELEASAYPMWALVSHLTDPSTAGLTRKYLKSCLSELRDWLDAIHFVNYNVNDNFQCSFHYPLHRHFAVFLCQGIAKQGIKFEEIVTTDDSLLLLIMHPLRVQVAFYEILNGLWVRNGLQIKGQAMTYIQCNFCNSMVDPDLYLLQLGVTKLPANEMLNLFIDKFHVKEWMSLAPFRTPQNPFIQAEHSTPMMEGLLTFLATLISTRANTGLTDTELNRLEMITLLCMGDKTHSQLMELMPEKCGTSQSRDFEIILRQISDYIPPTITSSKDTLSQGIYSPTAHVWEHEWDPIHALLRSVHRRDFRVSMDRYVEHIKRHHRTKEDMNLWPPYRDPAPVFDDYDDPRIVFRSKVFHAMALVVLQKSVQWLVTEHVMSLIIFLLTQAVNIEEELIKKNKNRFEATKCSENNTNTNGTIIIQKQVDDMDLENFFSTDNIFENLRTEIHNVVLIPEPEVSPVTYSSDSDPASENSEADTEMTDVNIDGAAMLMLQAASWNSQGNDLMVFVPPAHTPPEREVPQIRSNPVLALPPPTTSTTTTTTTANPQVTGDEISIPMRYQAPRLVNNQLQPPPPGILARAQLAAITAGNEVGRPQHNWPLPSSSHNELVPSTSTAPRTYCYRRMSTLEGATSNPPTLKFNESIISLLLKLHAQLSGKPDSYLTEDEEEATSSSSADNRPTTDPYEGFVGDGPFFIGKLLRKIAKLDENCRKCIEETRLKLWPTPNERDEAKSKREKEERRRRAKERQQKLMEEFASRQKQFMERTMETEETIEEEKNEDILETEKQYDCVICNTSTSSTEDNPMGLVVLVQATSVIGHRKRSDQPERTVLPTCEEERLAIRRDDTLATEFDRRLEELDRHFDPKSWYLSVNLGWDGGVHVQTCGHHLHLDCLTAYLQSLGPQDRQFGLSPEKGEYLCPLCRQLANSVLPLTPQLGDCAQVVKSTKSTMTEVLDEISEFLRENDQKPSNSNLAESIGKIMEVMTCSTQLKPMFKPKSDKPIPQSLFLFITSIARTNLEVELIQRGGTLVTPADASNHLLPIRDCIVPLLHVLSVHARVARVLAMWPAWMTFQQLCGLPPKPPSDTALAPLEQEVPLLLKDPVALLLQFVLLLPLHLEQTYFTTTVQMVYNLLYYQIVTQLSCGLSGTERNRILSVSNENRINNLIDALGLIQRCLGHTDLYMDDDDGGSTLLSSSSTARLDPNMLALEQRLQRLLLPFLRIAALLKYHIYQHDLPDIKNIDTEFSELVIYLDLINDNIDNTTKYNHFNAALALNWPRDTHMSIQSPQAWCNQYAVFVEKSQIAARSFIVDQHITWHPPRLMELPREYEKIFTYYHERPCTQCQSVPTEVGICLLCGTIVCLKQVCCKQQNICEATAHALECGAGTGIYLVVTSTYIIIIRGHRACLWGSLYLDEFDEEDRDLKRGKPLFLSRDRYNLLESQWLAHRFDHIKKTWVPHKNAL